MFVKPGLQTDDDKSSLCCDRFRLGTERGCLRDALNRIGDVAVCFAEVFRVAGERGACGCELSNARRLADHRYRGDEHANRNHKGAAKKYESDQMSVTAVFLPCAPPI